MKRWNIRIVSCTKSTGHAGVRIDDDFDKGDYEKCINLRYKSWRWLIKVNVEIILILLYNQ